MQDLATNGMTWIRSVTLSKCSPSWYSTRFYSFASGLNDARARYKEHCRVLCLRPRESSRTWSPFPVVRKKRMGKPCGTLANRMRPESGLRRCGCSWLLGIDENLLLVHHTCSNVGSRWSWPGSFPVTTSSPGLLSRSPDEMDRISIGRDLEELEQYRRIVIWGYATGIMLRL